MQNKRSIAALLIRMKEELQKEVHIAPLVVFRIVFGLMMLGGTIRFAAKGWIDSLYIKPTYFFTYYGFEWVKPLGETGMYVLFAVMGIAAFCMAIGCFYKASSALFFVVFTYIELIDKSNYLNHYYFVSIVAFIMIWLPAGRYFSVDTRRKPQLRITHIPAVYIRAIQLQLGMVYFFAGVAKLNSDWLFEAMPLRIWLQPHSEMPWIGWFMDKKWAAYFFSWFGAIYDLSIPFFLLNKKTRPFAYFFVVAFHVLTYLLFQIGLFPFIMILSTLIFFSEKFHCRILSFLEKLFPVKQKEEFVSFGALYKPLHLQLFTWFLIIHMSIQLAMPFRYLLYPGKLFWTEQGYRFSWRVMLMEKAGKAFFYITNPANGLKMEVLPSDYLTPNQEKMMATQPDMILQFAHYLKKIYGEKGIENPVVTVESYVTMNGSGSRKFIDDTIDLGKEKESFKHKTWILPFEEK